MTLPPQWSAEIANHELRGCDDIQQQAIRNMLVFPLAEVPAATLESPALEQFLMDVYREFLSKAAKTRLVGLFYAWFDEMSGTLRCSACSATAPKDLPFSCMLHIVDTPAPIAREVANSKYLSGIPAAELHESDFEDEADEGEFRLTVFARPLLRAV